MSVERHAVSESKGTNAAVVHAISAVVDLSATVLVAMAVSASVTVGSGLCAGSSVVDEHDDTTSAITVQTASAAEIQRPMNPP
jgi:hypothetical protein